MTNFDIAVLTAINDLALRHGIAPSDFIATVRDHAGSCWLQFEAPPEDDRKAERLGRILDQLGADGAIVKGTEQEVWGRLQRALMRTPRTTRML